MKWWWGLIAGLTLFLILILIFDRQSHMIIELKDKYRAMIEVLRATGDPLWHPILRESIITGISGKKDGVIGSNVNKGYEIYICLDGGDVNSAMYILIHEMAHMTVPEYDHTEAFWANFKKLKDLCISAGLYTRGGERQYCGDTIRD
jgi:hypothetical protein